MRKWIWLIAILTLISCAKEKTSKKNGKYGGVVKVALFDNPGDLDPRTYSSAASYRIIELVYSSLFRHDSTGRLIPDLVDSFAIENDLNYHIFLKNDVRFHDGSPLTAEDVAYTFQWMKEHQTANNPAVANYVDTIVMKNSNHVIFRLKEVYAPFLEALTTGIVSKKYDELHPDILHRSPMGSGPFRFSTWEQDASVVLKAFGEYFKGRPFIDQLTILIIPDANTATLALESGEIDFLMNHFSLSNLERFRENPRLKILKHPGSNYVYLGFNMKRRPLRKVKVRQAIAYAINRDLMLKQLYQNVHTKANSLLPDYHWAYNNDLMDYDYNIRKAKQLLDEAGYHDPDGDGPRTRFKLTYSCTDKQESRLKAQAIQNFLKKVGIEVKIKSTEWGTFFEDIKRGNFDMYSLQWVGVYEPDLYYHIFHSNSIGDGANRGRYRNSTIDRLIILAQSTTDQQMRIYYYKQIQSILQQEVPYVSLWHETNIAVMNKKLSGFKLLPAAEWSSFARTYWKP